MVRHRPRKCCSSEDKTKKNETVKECFFWSFFLAICGILQCSFYHFRTRAQLTSTSSSCVVFFFCCFFVLSNKQSNLKVYLNFNSRRSKGWKNFNYCVVKRFYNEVQRNFRNSLHFTISTRSTTRKKRRETRKEHWNSWMLTHDLLLLLPLFAHIIW